MKKSILFFILFLTSGSVAMAERIPMNEIRTYLSFTTPVDPAKIQTIPDMDLSYALGATLVEWSPEKQLTAGLADKWAVIAPQVYRLTLRKNARWSNGDPVTAQDVKTSLERGMAVHPEDLLSLKQMLVAIECPSDREIDFRLKIPAQGSGLLGKLTEPNYGILKIIHQHDIDLSISTGPYFLRTNHKNELVLQRNSNWHRFENEVPEKVVIRKPPNNTDPQTVLLIDSWPNLIETSSLISADMLNKYHSEKYEIWKRPLDKVFYLALGKKNVGPDGQALLRYLASKIDVGNLTAGLSGLTPTTQIFPRGYQLNEPRFVPSRDSVELPAQFKNRPVDIVISPSRVPPNLQENIRQTILNLTGHEPHFIVVAVDQIGKIKEQGNYDLYAGTVGLADPDPEGAMSFYLEGKAPVILPDGNNFLDRLNDARLEQDRDKRIIEMRRILNDAVTQGYILPLFHLSTVGLGKPGLDFSGISVSEESVIFSKIRFRTDCKTALQ
jgi:MarR-like DNA-binding transcriptional regulator SgrR of sgrS sRNA